MANARKLPSGAYQTRVTKVINGKKVTKSFTVHPKQMKGDAKRAKQLSEKLAREWQLETDDAKIYGVKVRDAIDKFMRDHSNVLSPSTLTNYRRILPYWESLMDICIDDIQSDHIQPLVNEMALYVSAKTIRNRVSFLTAALDYSKCDRKFRITYPLSSSRDIKSPELDDVKYLLRNAPEDLRPILYLAAVGGLRRGEIAALKEKDISRDMCTIFVHADMVLDGNKWVYKPLTKNALASSVEYSKFIIDMLPVHEDPEAYVFEMNPNMISHRYDNYRKKYGFEFNFHSLRHFAASFRSDLGIPRKYIEEACRWEPGSQVVDKVYDNTLKESRRKYTKQTNQFVEEELQFKEA